MNEKYKRILKDSWKMAVDLIATGKSLRQKRQKAGLTQEGLAAVITEYCDYPASPVTISYWETGKRAMSLAHAVFLSDYFGCRLDELVISFMRSYGKEQEDDQLVPFFVFTPLPHSTPQKQSNNHHTIHVPFY